MVVDTLTNAPKTMTSTSKTDVSASATQGSISGAHELPLDVFLGPVVVLDVSDLHGTIEFDPLMQRLATILPSGRAPQIVPRLLLKTGQTIANQKFPAEWPALSPQCAERLARDGLVLVGVDCPSVDDRESKTLAVHHALFDNGAYILENLDLRAAEPGQYELIAFPLKLKDLDAAPVRAVLLHPSDLQ
jgi:arylformamidase